MNKLFPDPVTPITAMNISFSAVGFSGVNSPDSSRSLFSTLGYMEVLLSMGLFEEGSISTHSAPSKALGIPERDAIMFCFEI
jgi:hypothetical protein